MTKHQPQPDVPNTVNKPLIVIGLVLVVCILIASVYTMLMLVIVPVFSGLGNLSGQPITVPDSSIESRAQTDVSQFFDPSYTFGSNLRSLDGKKTAYQSDISALHSEGNCKMRRTDIKKIQGGFDAGARIYYKGEVTCGLKPSYSVVVVYVGSALSKKEAADFKRFNPNYIRLTTLSESLIDSYLQRTDDKITPQITTQADQSNREPKPSAGSYKSTSEYKDAEASGVFAGCEKIENLSYTTEFGYSGSKVDSVSSNITNPDYRCE